MSHRTVIVVASVAIASLCPQTRALRRGSVQRRGIGIRPVPGSVRQGSFLRPGTAGRPRRDPIESLMFDVTYGLTDRLAVTFAVPFIRARYTGAAPHPNAQDDGARTTGFQDLRFGVRYNVTRGPLTITPFVGTNMPTHGYEYFAHAAYGPRVRELEVGTYVGRVLSPALPNAFIQARYSYSFAREDRRHRP